MRDLGGRGGPVSPRSIRREQRGDLLVVSSEGEQDAPVDHDWCRVADRDACAAARLAMQQLDQAPQGAIVGRDAEDEVDVAVVVAREFARLGVHGDLASRQAQ